MENTRKPSIGLALKAMVRASETLYSTGVITEKEYEELKTIHIKAVNRWVGVEVKEVVNA